MGARSSGQGEARLVRHDGLQRWLLLPTSEAEPRLRKVLEPSLALIGPLARDWLQRAGQNRAPQVEGCAEVEETGHDEAGVWATSRYASGITLADATREGVSHAVALYAAHSILTALEGGHARGLVHLDLDPAGILVRADGSLLLPEQGLWSALSPAELARVRFDAGRVAYLAPELVQARASDARSDLFMVGWLLYEWLAGRAPFEGDGPLALAMAIDGGQRRALQQAAPRVATELCEVVETLLQTEPSSRFQAAHEARSALEAAAPVDAVAARRELAVRVAQRRQPASEPRTRMGLGLLVRPLAPSHAAIPALRPNTHDPAPLAQAQHTPTPQPEPPPPPLLERTPPARAERTPSPRAESGLVQPPPLFVSASAVAAPAPTPRSQGRAPRARAVQGEPVHDGRTAFLRVESALRTVLPRKVSTSALAPRAVAGKWQDPSSTLFRVRRAALAGPVVRVAAWPRAWWLALGVGLGLPVVACVYLLCRLWF